MRRARLVCFLLVAGAFAFAGAVCSVLLASDSARTASGDNEARDQRFASTQCDCNNARAITGTAGFNFLIGTPGDDILCGFAGRDFLFGLRGNDCIDGGDGGDLILGGSGDDKLDGGEGFDRIFGGGGTDACRNGELTFSCESESYKEQLYEQKPPGALRLLRILQHLQGRSELQRLQAAGSAARQSPAADC